jgi:hypothetical protein
MAGLLFVNVDHPLQLTEANIRKKARSHVSRLQHKQRRDALERATERSEALSLEQKENMSITQHDSSAPNLAVSDITSPRAISHAMIEPSATTGLDLRCLELLVLDLVHNPTTTTTSGSSPRRGISRTAIETRSKSGKQLAEEDSMYIPQPTSVISKAQLSQLGRLPTFQAALGDHLSSLGPSNGHGSLAKVLDTISADLIVCLCHIYA